MNQNIFLPGSWDAWRPESCVTFTPFDLVASSLVAPWLYRFPAFDDATFKSANGLNGKTDNCGINRKEYIGVLPINNLIV
jgi:hypothetical protein